jgi:hypothetical protein
MMLRSLLARGFVAVMGMVGLGLAAPTPASAEDVSCDGTIGAVVVEGVVVPEGASCTLAGTRVRGSVTVLDDATLDASDVRVGGNVQADGAASIVIDGASRVAGNVSVDDGGSAAVSGVRIGGNLVFTDNAGPVSADANLVVGSVQVDGNTGGVTITANRIGNNLVCRNNAPAPTGGGNQVGGNRRGQCASF